MRKPTIWVSNQVRHKPGCTVTEEELFYVAKTKALISFTVTSKLIWPLFSPMQIVGFPMRCLISDTVLCGYEQNALIAEW